MIARNLARTKRAAHPDVRNIELSGRDKPAGMLPLTGQKAEATATAKPGPMVDRASLRLHVYGDTRLPDRLSATNVWRWFYLNDVLVMMKQDGTKDREIVTSKLFISFDQPVGVGTMTVRSDKPLSHYEVKEFNNRFAIVVFGEALPECNIDIEVNP
jgi:hypothetical protein